VAEPAPAPAPTPAPAAADAAPKTSGFIPLGNMKPKAAPAAKAPAPTPRAAAPAPAADAEAARTPAKANAPAKMKEAMRVDAERLDHLIETIGELVIAESMVSQSPELKGSAMSVKLAKDLDHLDKICRELQEIGMSLRMVPVRPVFQKMARLVRDLSKKQNRVVDFIMTGEDTELDKNVVDKIGDPLVHMVRNSVDHGIEADPADRVRAGKSERGRVELRAFHKGGNICIEIEDDGRGLNRKAIRDKAVSRGLLREGEQISDRDLFMMIFEPGFSTAKEVTDISGRGVGMDVVRRNIEELRGTVDIASEEGAGSTFSIKLPLTLAIIEGMVIMVGTEHYIIPTLSVVRLVRPRKEDLSYIFDKGEMIAFEGSHLPLFRLSRLFEVAEAAAEPHEAMVVVVEDEGKRIGLMADQLLGQQSIVIKSLGEKLQGTEGVAGGAIMSDGNVALILDIAGLVRVAHSTDMTVRNSPPAAASLDPHIAEAVETVIESAVAPGGADAFAPESAPETVEA
ncbi:chemotaxis protein CheA, partial [bacterium]|nr:chemotaxis protein CheA [bacterium]